MLQFLVKAEQTGTDQSIVGFVVDWQELQYKPHVSPYVPLV